MKLSKKQAASTETSSLASAPPPYDAVANLPMPSKSKWSGSCYQLWMGQAASNKTESLAKITTPDMTSLCTIHGFGTLLPPTSKMRIVTATGEDEELLADVTSNFEDAKSDPDMDIRMAGDENTPSGFVINLKRERGTFTRKHRMTLSDGKTYVITGKHSDNLMMCWGNLKVVEESSKSKLAEFKVEWWMSSRKIGIVTFLCEVQEHLMKEILFVLVGVASIVLLEHV
ncbi:MAG: hypothetical protein Q9205_003424 [Flavoplaca limonia]